MLVRFLLLGFVHTVFVTRRQCACFQKAAYTYCEFCAYLGLINFLVCPRWASFTCLFSRVYKFTFTVSFCLCIICITDWADAIHVIIFATTQIPIIYEENKNILPPFTHFPTSPGMINIRIPSNPVLFVLQMVYWSVLISWHEGVWMCSEILCAWHMKQRVCAFLLK